MEIEIQSLELHISSSNVIIEQSVIKCPNKNYLNYHPHPIQKEYDLKNKTTVNENYRIMEIDRSGLSLRRIAAMLRVSAGIAHNSMKGYLCKATPSPGHLEAR